MTRVTLNWYEHQLAGFCGVMRTVESHRRGVKRETKKGGSEVATDVESSGAELAVAKLLKVYARMGVNTGKEADVGENIQVRWTDKPSGRLIVRPEDRDDDVFFLVRGKMPDYDVVGCISGRAAKNPEFWDDPNGQGFAYWVPDEELERDANGWPEEIHHAGNGNEHP